MFNGEIRQVGFRRSRVFTPTCVTGLAVGACLLAMTSCSSSGSSAGSSSSAATGAGVSFYTKTGGSRFENGATIVVDRTPDKVVIASVDDKGGLELCKVLTPSAAEKGKYDEVGKYSPYSDMNELASETYLSTAEFSDMNGGELSYSAVDKDGKTETATLSPTSPPVNAAELSAAVEKCPDFSPSSQVPGASSAKKFATNLEATWVSMGRANQAEACIMPETAYAELLTKIPSDTIPPTKAEWDSLIARHCTH